MTDRAQFEAMLNALINEDEAAAKEIFHNIVVAKSREIYEELLESDFGREEEEEGEEEEEEEEGGEEEEEGSDDIGGDATDDFVGDVSDDETDSDAGEGEGDLEDRVLDLEDALEELKAEFDSLMADEANEPEHNDGVDDPDFGGEDDFGGEEEPAFGDEEGSDEFGGEEEEMEGAKEIHHYHHDGDKMPQDEFQAFMEYVHKVALPKHGDNGVNTKSVVDNMKNDMGGTNANILNGGTSTSGGTKGGLLTPSTDDLTKGLGTIQNRPDSKAGKTAFTKREPGHGPEKKGSGEKADNTKSMIGKRVR